ncbi:MAG TPA: DUF2461 domain-containing protein [Bacteroidia bacterium]|jgi:uncharacterized protein (TIGR02453 family)|nr:DUF2461 domain-containing protein [Bacteroidia bacterium]
MIDKTTLIFLTKLKKNNSKAWFDANRKTYDAARENVTIFIQGLLSGASRFEPGLSTLEARKCLFRINRDIRFSKDKSPYKTNFGASMNFAGKNAPGPGYYIHLEPGGHSFMAGGIYMAEPALLAAIRQEIDYNLPEFNAILGHKKFKQTFGELSMGDKLQRPPKGYELDNPALEHLKNRHFIVSHPIADKDLQAKNLSKKIIAEMELMKPFLDFLKRAVE